MDNAEGKLFEHIYLLHYGDLFTLCTDYYTVKEGLVVLVNNNSFQYSGDKLEILSNDCIEIGRYSPDCAYPMKRKQYTHKEFKKLFK